MLSDWLSRTWKSPGLSSRGTQRRGRGRFPKIAGVERLEDRVLLSYFFGYALQVGDTFADVGQAIAADTAGNVYVTGRFTGTVDFNPDSAPTAVFNMTSTNANAGFVAKYSPAGVFLWAVQMPAGGTSIALDSARNPYVSAENTIRRLDTATGATVWASSFGSFGSNLVTVTAVTIDSLGNVLATGTFIGTQDFDPSAGTTNLTSAGGTDVFVTRLTPTGALTWARQMGGNNSDTATAIAVDAVGSVYTTGSFFSTQGDFDPGPGTSLLFNSGFRDVFISKLDAVGNFVWARAVGSTFDDVGTGIAVDQSSNVYTTGTFSRTVDFNPAPGPAVFNLNAGGAQDVFVLKLDVLGNFVWADGVGGSLSFLTGSTGIRVDASGNNVFTTGAFDFTTDFDPGPGTFTLTSNGVAFNDIFVLQLNSAGGFISASAMGGPQDDIANGLALDGNGNVYTTGSFIGTADFDPRGSTVNRTTAGSNPDIFISKLVPPGFTITPTSAAGVVTTERGTTATFTVVLNTPPTANVTIGLSSGDLTEGTVAPASLTFTPLNWNVLQTVTVTGVDDLIIDGDITFSIVTAPAVSTDTDYNNLDPADVTVLNRDNDGAGINLIPVAGLVTTEAGGAIQFNVTLNIQPTAVVAVNLTSSNTGEGTVSPATLFFDATTWNIPQLVTVTGVDDFIADGDKTYTFSSSSNSPDARYDFLVGDSLTLTNTDDDVEAIRVFPTRNLTTTEPGGQATFGVVLSSQPQAFVTVPVHSSNTAEGVVSTPSLVFTTSDWNIPHDVTVTGVNDGIFDGNKAYKIVLDPAISADPLYNGQDPLDVSLTNIDDESARMFRAYNPNADYHFFTTSPVEFANAVQNGYRDETSGQGGFVVAKGPAPGMVPIHRMYSPPGVTSEGTKRGLQHHYYTYDDNERNSLVAGGWTWEKDEGYIFAASQPGVSEVFRLYNRNSGVHLFTGNASVRDSILASFPGIWVQHNSLGFAYSVNSAGVFVSGSSAAAVSAANALPATLAEPPAVVQMGATAGQTAAEDSSATVLPGTLADSAPPAAAAPDTALESEDEDAASAPSLVAAGSGATDDYWTELGRGLATGLENDLADWK